MKCLITGGNGFIASHMAKLLCENGHTVILSDVDAKPSKLALSFFGVTPVNYLQIDIVKDQDKLEKAIAECDWVFHFAAVVGVKNYIHNPLRLFDVNVMGSRHVVEACIKHGKRLIFSSTSEIYGMNLDVPWEEDADRVLGSTIKNRWSYSTSKAVIEHLLVAAGESNQLDYRIVRFFNAYGPGQRPIFLVSRSIHRALNGLPIEIFDGGQQTRSLTHVTDSVKGTYEVSKLEDPKNRVFNIGAMNELRLNEIISQIVASIPRARVSSISGKEIYGNGYEDLVRRVPSNKRLREETNWAPSIDSQQGILDFVEWAKMNPWWLAESSEI